MSVVASRLCPLPVVVSRRRLRCRPYRDHRRIRSGAVLDPATVHPKAPCMGGRCIMTLGGMAKRAHRRGQLHHTAKWALPLKLSCRRLHPHLHRLALLTGLTLLHCCGGLVAPKLKVPTFQDTFRSPTERAAGWSGGLAPPRTAPCTRPWLMAATEMACHGRCCRHCRLCLRGEWCLGRHRSPRRRLGRDRAGGAEGLPMGDMRHIRPGHRRTTDALTGSIRGRRKCRCLHLYLLIHHCRRRRRRTRPRRRIAQTGGAPV